MNAKNLFIKKIVFNQKYFLALALVIMCNSCKKDGGDAVSNSIFGIYETSEDTGSWWTNALGFGITYTKVSPGAADYIEIITNYNSIYPSFTTVFDSVQLFEDNSFKVDQLVKYEFSATGYAKAIGNGNFGTKTISLNFSLQPQPGDSTQFLNKIIITNAEKFSD